MSIRLCLAAAACALATVPGWAINQTEVAVSAEVTPEGKGLGRPEAKHPAYYVPMFAGFTEEGGSVASGEYPPPQKEVERQVELALSRQGYRVARPGLRVNANTDITYRDGTVVTVPEVPALDRPIALNVPGNIPLTVAMIQGTTGPYAIQLSHRAAPHQLASPLVQVLRTDDPVHGPVLQAMPRLVIVIQWGDMHAGDVAGGAGPPTVDFNLGMMVDMIAGGSFDKLTYWDQDDVIQRSHVDRFFVVVSAYDLNGTLAAHKKVLLWKTKMSLPSNMNAIFAERLPLMVRAGEPYFGRETNHPELLIVPLTKEGKVTVGTMEVKDYQEVPPTVPDTGSDRFLPFRFPAKK